MLTTEIFQRGWCNIVFTGRNKNYGAFMLRREYDRNLLLGLILTLLVPLVFIGFARIYSHLCPITNESLNPKVDSPIILTDYTVQIIPPQAPEQLKALKVESPTSNIVIKKVEPVDVKDPSPIEKLVEPSNGSGNPGKGPAGNGGDITSLPADEVFNPGNIQKAPVFPGGESALLSFIGTHIHYPQIAKENQVAGSVYITFVVDKTGDVTGVEVIRGIGAGCNEEAARVIAMLPKWTPGKNNGNAVKVRYTIPIKFVLR